MAAAQTAAEKVEEAKAAEEKAKADAAAVAAAPPSAVVVEPTVQTQLLVTGPAVVLATKDRSERYLYRGAPVSREAFTEESVKHAIDIGLVAEVEVLVATVTESE